MALEPQEHDLRLRNPLFTLFHDMRHVSPKRFVYDCIFVLRRLFKESSRSQTFLCLNGPPLKIERPGGAADGLPPTTKRDHMLRDADTRDWLA